MIIFNHRYDQNIELIRKLYGKRFECIRILMPFYDGDDKCVIPVYECSYQFQGYLIQAYDRLMETGASYFFFVSDDVMIHPAIDQNNLIDVFQMRGRDVFFDKMFLLNSKGCFREWIHSRYSSRAFLHKSTKWQGSIPDFDKAIERFNVYFGFSYPTLYSADFFEGISTNEVEEFVKNNGDSRAIPYPMAYGYSDIFMISKEKLLEIARICGVFAAMNLFAEIAIPTSIILTVKKRAGCKYRSNKLYKQDLLGWYSRI